MSIVWLGMGTGDTSSSFSWFGDGKTLVTGMNNRQLRVYDLRGSNFFPYITPPTPPPASDYNTASIFTLTKPNIPITIKWF